MMTRNGITIDLKKVSLVVGALVGLATLVAAVDQRYVKRDAFDVIHLRDSLVNEYRMNGIQDSLGILLRACRRKGDCY